VDLRPARLADPARRDEPDESGAVGRWLFTLPE
jgi:hypothetical protein